MWCEHCGNKLPDNARICPACGKTVPDRDAGLKGLGFTSAGSLLDADEPVMRDLPTAHSPAHGTLPPPIAPQPPKPRGVIHPSHAPKPKSPGEARRIPFARELKLLLRQGWLVMLGERRNLIFSLMFPLLAAVVTVWVAGKNMFDGYEYTKSACFVLVCSAIWCGLFNSIQTVVKERENIKRDYVSGALRIECYVLSRALLQMCLCLIQCLILVMAIPGVNWAYGNSLPSYGLILPGPMIEYYISLFLLMYAADVMGLLVSSIVKKAELASQLAPYILIVQLLFSGVLFKMEGGAEGVSALMLSRWGMEALGSISDLNDLPLKIMLENDNPMLEELIDRDLESCFEASGEHLLLVWVILLVFVAVQLIAANYFLRSVKKDTRM